MSWFIALFFIYTIGKSDYSSFKENLLVKIYIAYFQLCPLYSPLSAQDIITLIWESRHWSIWTSNFEKEKN